MSVQPRPMPGGRSCSLPPSIHPTQLVVTSLRDYLKKLIVGMGASFNPTMRQGDSPILIAAR